MFADDCLKWCVPALVVVLLLSGGVAHAVTIETVPVGNLGNAGELSGGYAFERVCGAVDYTYDIGKYEVTAGQYRDFLNAVAATDSYGLYSTAMNNDHRGCQITRIGDSGSYTYDFSGGTDEAPGSTAADWEDRPVNCVSWGDAARFANWLHNGQPTGAQDLSTTEDGAYYLNGAVTNAALKTISRESDWKWAITSEDEWYKAAYHDKSAGLTATYFDYPTSSDTTPSNDLTDPDGGNNANFLDAGYTIDSPYYHTEVGEFESSESPYDTFDQGGNVFEWNEQILNGSYRGWRGGSFNYDDSYLEARYRFFFGLPENQNSHVGFRVVSIPEPGSLVMLAGIVVMGLLYRASKRASKRARS